MIATRCIPRLLISVFCWLSVPEGVCDHADGQIIKLPTGANSTSGLRLSIDANWVDGPGYRPVTLRVETANGLPSSVDRELLVEICPSVRYRRRRELSASRFVQLTEGERTATATLYLPTSGHASNTRITVWEDGTRIPDLSIEGYFRTSQSDAIEPVPHILVLAKGIPTRAERNQPSAKPLTSKLESVPELEPLLAIVPDSHNARRMEFGSARLPPDDRLRLTDTHHAITLLRPEELPASWIGLTAMDLIFLRFDDLEELQRSDKIRFGSLLNWSASGGTLCVYEVGGYDTGLAQLTKLLGARTSRATHDTTWTGPTRRAFNRLGRDALRILQWDTDPDDRSSRRKQARFEFDPSPFVHRPFGFGQVFAFEGSPFPGTELNWQLLFHEVGSGRWLWPQRHGLSLLRQNSDYWNFVIAGVGIAPVGAFLVLISLFAVTIGPVNYFLLHRFHRLNWLLVTIPLGAMVVTGGLVSYAFIADGLDVQLRARSVTLLDTKTGEAVSWSRQTYYAGLAPSQGLKFPADAAVYPLEQYPQGSGGSLTARHLRWDAEHQHLRSGYMPSRWQTQFVVIHPRITAASVRISDDSGTIRATNHLGAEVSSFFLRKADGSFLVCAGTSPMTATVDFEFDGAGRGSRRNSGKLRRDDCDETDQSLYRRRPIPHAVSPFRDTIVDRLAVSGLIRSRSRRVCRKSSLARLGDLGYPRASDISSPFLTVHQVTCRWGCLLLANETAFMSCLGAGEHGKRKTDG